MSRPAAEELLRRLPSVEELAASMPELPHHLAVSAAREAIDGARQRILADDGGDPPDTTQLRDAAVGRAERLRRPSLRRVINATGVIVHTNLGRAPLVAGAVGAAASVAAGYSNLEYDLELGARGSRHVHVESLLCALTGAEAAIAVNNNAAAVLLALAATAAGREVVISRGELIEIGGSFRIPEILEQSGARLVEVGTTNRTRIADYESAIGPDTAAVLRVHQSNFRTVGFTEEASLGELAQLARERDIALIDDLGSGALAPIGDEPPVRRSIDAGADLVCASGDKLLGGPQAGILAGRWDAVERCRNHPLARVLRIEKLQLAALEATLRIHRDEGPSAIPVLAMLSASEEELAGRAAAIAEAIGPAASVERSASRPGGGALPLMELEGPVCAIDPGPIGADELAARLREAEPPVIARVADECLILDPRTMSDSDAETAALAAVAALH